MVSTNKRGRKPPPTPDKPTNPVMRAHSEIEIALDTLVDCRTKVREMLTKAKGKDSATYDVKLSSHLAWVTKMTAGILNDLARIANRERKRIDDMDYDDLLAWARRQTADMRAQLVRDVIAIDDGGSVLA